MACKLWFIMSHHSPPEIHKNSNYWQTFFAWKSSTQAVLNTWRFWDSDELGRAMKPLWPFPIPCPLHPFHTAVLKLHLFRTNERSSKYRHISLHFIACHYIVLQLLHFLFCCLVFFVCLFCKLKVCGNPVPCHFSNSVCSLHVFESHFGNSCTISNI